MGSGGAGYHSSRAEFLSDENLNDGLKYSRNGGCFVTTKKAIAFVVVALASLICVALLMYYYGPNKQLELLEKESNDIEQLLNDTLNERIPEEELRLPNSIYPISYRLWVHPILDENQENNFTFTGRVKIVVNCTRKTDKIALNIDDLNVTHSDVKVSTTKQVEVKFEPLKEETSRNVTKRQLEDELNLEEGSDALEDEGTPTVFYNEENTTTSPEVVTTTEQLLIHTEVVPLTIDRIEKDPENFKMIIHLKYLLEENHVYTVDIKFSGEILNNLVGLYKTSYTDVSGEKKWLVTTHMQSVYARRVFPCFDEPSFKATFEVSLARRNNMTSLSNMPLKESESMNTTEGWVWDHFLPTPPMSTYLLAFTISDFEYHSAKHSASDLEIRIHAPKSDLPKIKYALEVTQEILPFLENYFGMAYPLPKLDMIAIPNFGKEAMENWGLISFRKSSLLFDPNSRSIKTKSFIFAKLAHELTHQWFGNLVTMEWWSDLWLNEGFGTFMAEVVVTSLRPSWQAYSSLQLRDTYKTLYYDCLKTTRSVQTEVSSPAEIEQIFDPIIYQKGSSVLKMLNYTITKDVFRKGLRDYLKKFAFTTATQDDLWEIFTEDAHNQSTIPENVTVKALMNSWTTQSGYPYLTVTRDYLNATAVINQTKMTEDSNVTTDALWFVPITYLTADEPNVKNIWLENSRETTLNLNNTGNDSWVLLNIDEMSFYRVNYDIRNWKLLQYQLRKNPNKIPVSNRGQLIDDAFQLARAGTINYTVAFDLVKYLNLRETNYIPWYGALRNMEELRVIISNYEYSGLYDNFLLKLVKPVFDELSVSDKNLTQNEKLLKLHIVTSACKLNYAKCISWAKTQYKSWMNMSDPDKRNPIPVDYRFIVQCSAIKSSGPDEWEFLWNRTLNTNMSPTDLQIAYLSLGCTYDPWMINRYLEYSLAGNITLENVPNVWRSISHPVGVRTGFQFLRLNWDRIHDTYEDIYLVFSTIFHDFVSQLSTEVDLEDLTTFYKLHQNDLKPISGILQSTVDQMKVRIKWRRKHLNSVVNWLKENKY